MVGVVAAANAMATDVAKVAFILCPKLMKSKHAAPTDVLLLPPVYSDFIGEQLGEWVMHANGQRATLCDYKPSLEEDNKLRSAALQLGAIEACGFLVVDMRCGVPDGVLERKTNWHNILHCVSHQHSDHLQPMGESVTPGTEDCADIGAVKNIDDHEHSFFTVTDVACFAARAQMMLQWYPTEACQDITKFFHCFQPQSDVCRQLHYSDAMGMAVQHPGQILQWLIFCVNMALQKTSCLDWRGPTSSWTCMCEGLFQSCC